MQLVAYTGNSRAALFCVACDVPATRKACVFLAITHEWAAQSV